MSRFALAPDLSMAGYLAGPAVGSRIYNLFHTYTVPLAVGGVGVWTGATVALLVAAVWAGHIGADRLVGYGLKYEDDFRHTHLSAPGTGDTESQRPTARCGLTRPSLAFRRFIVIIAVIFGTGTKTRLF